MTNKTTYICECGYKTTNKIKFTNHQENTVNGNHEKYILRIPKNDEISKLFPPIPDKNCTIEWV